VSDVAFTALKDFVQKTKELLVLQLREDLPHRTADWISAADQISVGLIGELKSMIWLRKHCNEAGSLFEKLSLTLDFDLSRALCQHLGSGLGARTKEALNGSSFSPDWRVGEGEVGLFQIPSALHPEGYVVHVNGLAAIRLIDDWAQVGRDLRPNVKERAAKRARMLPS
jgi:hypothetical protein